MNSKSGDAEVRFSHVQAEASYRLVGSLTDYVFADSCDLSYGCKVEFIMPEVLFGKSAKELQDTIMMLSFDKKGHDIAAIVREALPEMASQSGYELADTGVAGFDCGQVSQFSEPLRWRVVGVGRCGGAQCQIYVVCSDCFGLYSRCRLMECILLIM